MEKRLNLDQLSRAMDNTGLNQSALARQLSVSRETVSKWLRGESFPRPDKLLHLGKLLGLGFSDLVVKEDPDAPVVAFRKMKGTKTRDHNIENAQTMCRMLQHLVPYLPFDVLSMQPVLKEPRCEYVYLQQVTRQIRQQINVTPTETIDFEHLIRHFGKLQAVVIPVLWGNRQRHENATHIYLPASQTTWIYLNLDVNVHDFKFWMAHELGHCLAPDLRGDAAEDFADLFAGTLLFPHELASVAYQTLSRLRSDKRKMESILELADKHMISPLTVYKQVNFYAETYDKTALELEPAIHGWITRFNEGYLNVSDSLFDGDMPPEPEKYLDTVTEIFETPFFSMLGKFLKEQHKGPGFVQTVMDVPLLDARSLHDALT
jgi:transcriptional regulator with XRE-family HTH domain/Zn-dependent peptidase ImmA (M78 family)